jgi:DNA-binding MarR family transcriptional regulator
VTVPRRGAPALPLDSSLFFKLVRVVNLTARPFVETLARTHQLSLNEWRVMVVLANRPGVAASDLAAGTGLDKMSISRAVAALSRHGRLRKQVDAQDGRRTLLWLNAAGVRVFRTIGERAKQREVQLFGGIDAAELQRLDRLMDQLLAALAEGDARPPAVDLHRLGGSDAAQRRPGGTQ